MPQLGEDIAEGTVAQWFVREGDYVVRDQVLLEVETSKADTEIPSPTNGVVTSIDAAVGEVVPKQGLLCRIDETRTS
ncbi:biotin/lipoyl-containing protein [Nannocystis punicea]|uniref:Biotin/lipoyl-binding protein n=1 Tax=Nannocystis punicea TaxID=2995304 RepID=A0ABY7H7D8_9BACT|nr:biotin/lipoyl-containing protein [Nannocystis poenicansa]WAS95191.1 biotin/lipoyl-binding protein [Nannocystis poenicansa]